MSFPLLITPLLAAVDGRITSYFTSASGRMAAAAAGPFRILVSVYVVLWGLAAWRGLIKEPLGEAVSRLLRVVLIGTLALHAGLYSSRIAQTIYSTGDEIAAAILPAGAEPAATTLDRALDKGNEIALNYMDRVSALSVGSSLAAVLSALVVWIFTAVVVLYGAALVLISKVALGLILAFGPLFIAALLYEPTKRCFESWLHQAVHFMLLTGLVAGAIALMFALFDAQLTYAITDSAVSAKADFSALLGTLVTGGACLVVLHQLPSVASGLAGGVRIGTLGAVGWSAHQLGGLRPAALGRRAERIQQGVRADARALAAGATAAALPARWMAERVRGTDHARGA